MSVATLHRQYGDQNRAWGLLATADMLPWLIEYDARSSHDAHGGWSTPTLHIDVHSFDVTQRRNGWGSGVNIIVLHEQEELRRFAERVAGRFDAMHGGHRTAVHVMRHASYGLWDGDVTALCHVTRARGACSILVELPVSCVHGRPSEDDEAYVFVHELPMARCMSMLLEACMSAAAGCVE